MRAVRRFWFIPVLGLILIAATASFIALRPANPMPEALDALKSDVAVTVTDIDGLIVMQPTDQTPTLGVIFYPGGLVDPRAYGAVLRPLAADGNTVVIVPMPLNLAVMDANAADRVIAALPEVEVWVIGGHSLGAAMSARYVYENPERVRGLFLWGGYPDGSNDLSNNDVPVISINGTLDGLATVEQINATRRLLPASAEVVFIEGGNHANFGSYGEQARDRQATISRDDQQAQIAAAMGTFLESLRQNAPF